MDEELWVWLCLPSAVPENASVSLSANHSKLEAKTRAILQKQLFLPLSATSRVARPELCLDMLISRRFLLALVMETTRSGSSLEERYQREKSSDYSLLLYFNPINHAVLSFYESPIPSMESLPFVDASGGLGRVD